KEVSERHCIIKPVNGKFEVEDLDTSFGTFLNGEKITRAEAKFNDEIKVGTHTLEIKKTKQESPSEAQEDAYLLGVQGRMEGRKFEIKENETKIGRSEDFNDVWISKDVDKSVSRRHATIIKKEAVDYAGSEYVLTDKRSRNRTFVNKKQVGETDEVRLKNGDEILIGRSIFRFITQGKDDYSLPKKAGVFWNRFFPRFKKFFGTAVVIAGILFIYKGWNAVNIIKTRPSEVYLEELNWRPRDYSNTGEYLSESVYDIIPSPAIGDVDGDGKPEVVISDPQGRVNVWKGSDGKLLWRKKIGQSMLTSPVLADMNNDKIKDVIIGSDNSRIYILDGKTGQLIYRSSFIGGKILFASSPLVVDLNDDGFKDLVLTTDDRVICFIYSPVIESKEPYYFRSPDDIFSSPVIIKTKQGPDKVAVATNGGKIYFFDAANPENREVADITRKINMLEGINLVLNEISSTPAVFDLDNDGNEDVIFATSAYYIMALSGADYSLLWAYKIQPYSTLSSPVRYASPAVTVIGGKKPAVMIGWANGKIISLNGKTGEFNWRHSVGEKNRVISSPALSDFNKDGIIDSILGLEDGSLIVVDGDANNSFETVLHREKVGEQPITSTPCLGDVSGDGFMDVVVSLMDGSVKIYRTSTKIFKNKLVWNSYRKGPENRGAIVETLDINKYRGIIGIGGVLIFGVGFISFVRKRSKIRKRPQVRKI
ncbi:MAG: FHA domain-containing protein, partial [Elusimicrobiota bacterium]